MWSKKMGFLISVLLILVLGGTVYLFMRCQKPIHVSTIVINRKFDEVWNWISDPTKYDKLYPNWIKKVERTGENTFTVHDQFLQSYPVKLNLNREFGIIDLYINLPTGEEVSRTRIYSIISEQTAVTHLTHRFKGASSVVWFFHKRTIDHDFENAKHMIEAGGSG